MALQWLVIIVFGLVYLGMALGRWPGLAVDRTGIAMIGAIALFLGGAADVPMMARVIDFRMLAVLFALMVVSAQFSASGFFPWVAGTVAATRASPRRILAVTVVVAGALSALLTNDVVVWAMAPVLVRGLKARGLDAGPYVIALAMAANAGSAATMIGNPQNLLIESHGGLGFWPFLSACAVPAVIALFIVYIVISRQCAAAFAPRTTAEPAAREPAPQRAALAKGLVAALFIIAVFTLPVDRAPWALAVAGLLLLSRRFSTLRMLSMVDWHLLVLFAALFVVTGAFAATGLPTRALAAVGAADLHSPVALALAAVIGSNTIGNVPLVMLLLAPGIVAGTPALYGLALFSTLAGNLFLMGSLANIIAVERARGEGVTVGFVQYARIGIPVTILSIAFAWNWVRFALPLISS